LIEIQVQQEGGLFKSIQSEGHASSSSLPCAAVSVLLRTFARTLEASNAVKMQGGASERGLLELEITAFSGSEGWLHGVTDLLLQGLDDLRNEFPKDIQVQLTDVNHQNQRS
jgi:uncharacterized protein YsxB (DUF464 family)